MGCASGTKEVSTRVKSCGRPDVLDTASGTSQFNPKRANEIGRGKDSELFPGQAPIASFQ